MRDLELDESKREPLFPRDYKPSLRIRLKWWWNKWIAPIKRIPQNIRVIISWIPHLWDTYDWDYVYLLMLMQEEMRRMSKCIRSNQFIKKADEVGDELDECVAIIERLTNSFDYTESEMKAHEEKWGPTQMDMVPVKNDDRGGGVLDIYHSKAREQGKDDQADEERRAIYKLHEQREQEDYDRLFEIMRTKIRGWWD